MVKKKYELILSMLKNERLTYFNQVKKTKINFKSLVVITAYQRWHVKMRPHFHSCV